jgi:hypothetical protein
LKANSVLTALNLSGNGIGHEGVKHIVEALKTNNVISSLDLSNNDLGDEGAQFIVEALDSYNFSVCNLDGVNGIDSLLERNRLIVRGCKLRVGGLFNG